MITFITNQLAIGEFSDIVGQTHEETLQKIRNLKELGITHVINCRETNDEMEQKGFRDAWRKTILIRYIYEPVPADPKMYKGGLDLSMDKVRLGFQNVLYAIGQILFLQEREDKILVHCTAGMERSPFIVAKLLVDEVKSGWTDEEGNWLGHKGKPTFHQFRNMADAYKFIKSKRPCIIEHYEWIWWDEKVLKSNAKVIKDSRIPLVFVAKKIQDSIQKNLKDQKLVSRKCPKCGGDVVKYSPTGNFQSGFWYECKGCGYPIGKCICRR